MNRKTTLRRQRTARDLRAHAKGAKFVGYLRSRKELDWPIDEWMAHHIGRLVQRVNELESRVARLEGKR